MAFYPISIGRPYAILVIGPLTPSFVGLQKVLPPRAAIRAKSRAPGRSEGSSFMECASLPQPQGGPTKQSAPASNDRPKTTEIGGCPNRFLVGTVPQSAPVECQWSSRRVFSVLGP